MANAGRVLILAKGAWSATTNYVQLDMVSHNSVAYLARQASVGVDPSTDVAMNYWMPFGSAAQIATTSTPGLVMPDGTTITITNTGLIKAVLGINDITEVTITSPTNGQVLRYNSTTQKWENASLGTAANKDATSVITSGSTDLIEAGAVYSANQTLTNDVAYKVNLTSISETGTTSSQAISNGTFFYLNGSLVRAKADIASGATFTLNTNYEVVTAGGLNVLNSIKQDEWTYKGYTTGTGTKDFSNESFNEIKFLVHITHDGANYEFSGSLTRDDILNGTNNIFIIGGYYLSATNNCAVGINVPSTMLFGLRWIFFNSVSESANATVRYYTR